MQKRLEVTLMDKQTGPNDFLVVLPGEIIEIPQDSDKSWLTLFYSLPRELAEKWKPAYDLPRSPYEVLRTDKYDHIVCDDTVLQTLLEQLGITPEIPNAIAHLKSFIAYLLYGWIVEWMKRGMQESGTELAKMFEEAQGTGINQ